MPDRLTKTDVLTLATLARLEDQAYGVAIRDEILKVTGREPSIAAVYAALDRLERQGLAATWRSAPRPERGGRSRRQFRLTESGRRALRHERDAMARLWQGLDLDPEPEKQT